MAIQFTADGQDYTRTLTMGTIASLSVSCWWKITTDRNTWSSPWFVDNGTGDNIGIQTSNDGTTMGVVDGGTTLQNMGSATVGVWYWTLLSWNAGVGTLYWRSAASPTLTAVAITGGTPDVSAATMRIGESPWGTEYLIGAVSAFKLWTGVVASASDALAESQQVQPAKSNGLAAFYPFDRPDSLDLSGSGRSLAGSGATYTDGPPIPAQRIVVRRWLGSGAAAGGADLNLEDPSAGGVRAGTAAETAAVGVTLADPTVGATSSTANAETVAVGVAVSDPSVGGSRSSGTAGTVASSLVLTDTTGAARVGGSTDALAVGVALTDPSAGGVRGGSNFGETATTALVVTDPTVGGVRSGTTSDTTTAGLLLTDTPAGVRTGSTADTPAAGLLYSDAAGGIRVGSVFGETATVALTVLDPSTGQIRLGTVGGETVAQGTGLSDPTVGGVRLGGTTGALLAGLLFTDIPSGLRTGFTADTAAWALVLSDTPGSVRAGSAATTVSEPGAAAPTPPERVFAVAAEDRTVRVLAENRTDIVPADSRTVEA